MLTRTLHENWSVQALPGGQAPGAVLGRPLPATVPGAVTADLLQAGLIDDPFLDANEREMTWIPRTAWRYRTTVPAMPAAERVDLVFDGLDTVATVSVDGHPVGTSRNMHRSYRYDVTAAAAAGFDLSVEFASVYAEAQAVRDVVGPRSNAYPEPFQFVRKMACSFGWDWGPTLPGPGIWREVRLEAWNTARLAEVRPRIRVDADGGGIVDVDVEVERTASAGELSLRLTVVDGDQDRSVVVGLDADGGSARMRLPQVRRWWPHTMGEQPLYPVLVELLDEDEVLDRWERRCGFRTVALDRSPDADGTRFTFRINGIDIFARGYNWIPEDIFPGLMTADRYRRALQRAVDTRAELIRVWGGGIYESREFYEACDELGLLVWQDFPFACAAYPEHEPLWSEIEAEAAENVVRLLPHPSLVLWNGNNEDLWLCDEEHWSERVTGVDWGEKYYLEVLPAIVAELEPDRPYTAGSPWSGSWANVPNDPDHQTMHSWDVWNKIDYAHYRDSRPRFMAEFGWQAPATYATVRRAISDPEPAPDSPNMLHHQKAGFGQDKLNRGLADHFRVPEDFDSWHYLTQLNQCRAIATGIEHWRACWPRTAGAVLWQLNDIWPVTSWSAVDGDGRPKPLWHIMRHLFADLLLAIRPGTGGPELVLSNLSGTAVDEIALVRRLTADGAELARAEIPLAAAPRTVASAPLTGIGEVGDPSAEFVIAELAGQRAWWFALPDKDFRYPSPSYQVEVSGDRVTITARTLVRDLLLQADRLHPDAVADTGHVSMLPGDSVIIRVTGVPEALTAEMLAEPFVLTDLATVLRSGRTGPAV